MILMWLKKITKQQLCEDFIWNQIVFKDIKCIIILWVFDLLLCVFWNLYSIETTHVGNRKLVIITVILGWAIWKNRGVLKFSSEYGPSKEEINKQTNTYFVIFYAYLVNLCTKNSTICFYKSYFIISDIEVTKFSVLVWVSFQTDELRIATLF